ncbi:excalibur calcium-binding domain-containing protein [Flavobacterium sp. H4147]|uniref:excalibur calcium-binding domain-containing protein n=1 Tax=Flavobacterium sp. H4147 TaxID=3034149 RepID=UPI0023EAFD20|nr:excalibur calcium-binding domain-containing protein [Flavobacterium sp. H4147]
MGYRRGYYRKDGTYVQGHFANNRSKFSNKNNGCILIILVFIAFSSMISCSESSDCPTKTCGDFSTQAQAQATYDSNRSCYKNLDADGDGKACESLK